MPQVGTIRVAGIPFEKLTDYLRAEIGRTFRNFDINVNIGQLRSIQIFVVGDAKRPGSYTVSSLSTLVNALFPQAVASPPDTPICYGATATLNADISLGTSYTWSNSGTLSNEGDGSIGALPFPIHALANPLTSSPSARLYKTGDLGRFRPDGNIEYLGRIDDQVKIRGFRIELGEIEAALVSHAGVQEAVVVAREDVKGEKRLVAYYTACDTNGPTMEAGELRSHLSSQLPD